MVLSIMAGSQWQEVFFNSATPRIPLGYPLDLGYPTLNLMDTLETPVARSYVHSHKRQGYPESVLHDI